MQLSAGAFGDASELFRRRVAIARKKRVPLHTDRRWSMAGSAKKLCGEYKLNKSVLVSRKMMILSAVVVRKKRPNLIIINALKKEIKNKEIYDNLYTLYRTTRLLIVIP